MHNSRTRRTIRTHRGAGFLDSAKKFLTSDTMRNSIAPALIGQAANLLTGAIKTGTGQYDSVLGSQLGVGRRHRKKKTSTGGARRRVRYY